MKHFIFSIFVMFFTFFSNNPTIYPLLYSFSQELWSRGASPEPREIDEGKGFHKHNHTDGWFWVKTTPGKSCDRGFRAHTESLITSVRTHTHALGGMSSCDITYWTHMVQVNQLWLSSCQVIREDFVLFLMNPLYFCTVVWKLGHLQTLLSPSQPRASSSSTLLLHFFYNAIWQKRFLSGNRPTC